MDIKLVLALLMHSSTQSPGHGIDSGYCHSEGTAGDVIAGNGTTDCVAPLRYSDRVPNDGRTV